MDSGMRIVYPCDSNKELSSEFRGIINKYTYLDGHRYKQTEIH